MAKFEYLEPVIAHRGASAYTPENTLAAFQHALNLGGRAIEFDIMMNHEGDLFVFHDDKLDRTTNAKGLFVDASSSFLSELDTGIWFSPRHKGEKILTLDAMIAWLNQNQMKANMEIKPSNGNEEALTAQFLGCLSQKWTKGKPLPLVSSFNHDVLRLCERLSPELPLGILYSKWDKHWEALASETRAYSIHLSERLVTKKRLKQIKEAGYKICIYTVNSKQWARRYFAWGADSVFTDYPDLMSD